MIRRVLGIDPGSHHLGLGCVERSGNTFRMVFAEILHAKKSDSLYDRLAYMSEKLSPIIEMLAPTEVALEDTFASKNVKSALVLGMTRGVALAACFGKSVRFFEYAPTQVKLVVTGYGKADKNQVAKMVKLTLGLGAQWNMGADATDALAVAICHASHAGLSTRQNNFQESRDVPMHSSDRKPRL